MDTKCPHCGKEYEVGSEYTGAETSCLVCKKAFVIKESGKENISFGKWWWSLWFAQAPVLGLILSIIWINKTKNETFKNFAYVVLVSHIILIVALVFMSITGLDS